MIHIFPITNKLEEAFEKYDSFFVEFLGECQLHPIIGTFPAIIQALTSTVTAVVTSVFVLLAGFAGLVFCCARAHSLGINLLVVAVISVRETLKHLINAGFSILNACSFTLLSQRLAVVKTPKIDAAQ